MQSDLISSSFCYSRSLPLGCTMFSNNKVGLLSNRQHSQCNSSPLCSTIQQNFQFHEQSGRKVQVRLLRCNCKAYNCTHPPNVNNNGKIVFPSSVIGKPASSSHPPIPKIVVLSALSFHISMHAEEDGYESGKLVTRQALADVLNSIECDVSGLPDMHQTPLISDPWLSLFS